MSSSIIVSGICYEITADGRGFLRASKELVQIAYSSTNSIEENYNEVNQIIDRFGAKCYDSFNSVADALESAMGIARNALSGLVNSFADYGDKIAKMSQRTGIAAQSLSEFDYIAGQCGTSLDTFETAIKTMEKTLAGAANGANDAQNKLANLGIALYEIRGKTPDEQFRRIAQAIASLPDPAQRAAAAMAMFGRSGTDLLPLMNQGADAIDELTQKAHDFGLVLSDEDYKAAENAQDAMDNLKRSFDGMKMQLSSALVPILTTVTNGIANVSSKVIAWAQENPAAAQTIAAIVTALTTLVAGLYGTAKAFQALHAAMSMMEAHPIILALTAVVSALVALVAWYKKAASAADELYRAQKKLSDEHKTSRQTTNGYIDRLAELNNKNSLSTSEQAELKYIVGELNAEYTDLGLTVDETTGKVVNLAEAIKQIRQEQRAQRKFDIIKENQALDEQKKEIQGRLDEYYVHAGVGGGGDEKDYVLTGKAREEAQNQVNKLQKQINDNQRLIDAIDAGMDEYEGSIPFEPEKEEEAGPTNAQKAASTLAEDIAHANDTRAQQEVRRLNDQFETIVTNRTAEIKESDGISAEEAEKRAREELSDLRKSVDEQIKDITDKAAEEDKRQAEEEKKRAEEEQKRQEEAEQAKQKSEKAQAEAERKRQEEEQKRKEQERARNTVSDADKKRSEFDLRQAELVATLQEGIETGSARKINTNVRKLENLDAERQKFEREQAVERFSKASENYGTKKEALAAARRGGNQDEIDQAAKEFKEATEELAEAQRGTASIVSDQQRAIKEAEDARRRQMEEDAAAAEEASQYAHEAAKRDYESKGTFNALEAAALGQANDYDRKIYENGEEQVRYLRYLYELQNNNQQSSAVFA